MYASRPCCSVHWWFYLVFASSMSALASLHCFLTIQPGLIEAQHLNCLSTHTDALLDKQIGQAVAVEFACGHGFGKGARGETLRGLEGAVAIAQQNRYEGAGGANRARPSEHCPDLGYPAAARR